MILTDVNVLVYAHRADAPDHLQYRSWLQSALSSASAFGISELVLSGFLRIVTHSRIFQRPSPLNDALQFVHEVRDRANCVILSPGERHWDIFEQLIRDCSARGNRIPDAYHAALAIESGSEWITTDRDFARFRGLRWRHPLEA